MLILRLVCLLSDRSQDKIMSLACKLFLTFLYVRSAAIVNSGQHGLSREKGLQNPKPRPIRTTDGLRKILYLRTLSMRQDLRIAPFVISCVNRFLCCRFSLPSSSIDHRSTPMWLFFNVEAPCTLTRRESGINK
jgi:hypothetical protein